ncbi:MAG: helix-turn-helix domain-containing protein [Acidobacteriia bacterium]|nr:helix-turn-helix domain-containing protein [Terriglobia bacterium]
MKIGEPFNPRRLFIGIWIPEQLAATKLISPSAKLVYGHLARRAGENGHCFPSRKDIGEHTGIQERQVVRVLKELVDAQFIRIVPRSDDSGRRTSNEYEFLWHEILIGPEGEGVIHDTLGGVTNDTGRVSPPTPTRVSRLTPLEERTKNHHQQKREPGKEKSVQYSSSPPAVPKAQSPIPSRADDDETAERYASAEDELKAIFEEKAGARITIDVLDAIRGNLADRGVSIERFVEEVRSHKAGNWKNPPGFLRNLSRTVRTRTAVAGPPVTAAEAADRDYQCPHCQSRKRGQGAVLVDGKPAPCGCASAEYIQKQIERGVFAPSSTTLGAPRPPHSELGLPRQVAFTAGGAR